MLMLDLELLMLDLELSMLLQDQALSSLVDLSQFPYRIIYYVDSFSLLLRQIEEMYNLTCHFFL